MSKTNRIDSDILIVEILDGSDRTQAQLELLGRFPAKIFTLQHAIVKITKGNRPPVIAYARPVFDSSTGQFVCAVLLLDDLTPQWVHRHIRRVTKAVDREIKRLLAEKARQARSEVR